MADGGIKYHSDEAGKTSYYQGIVSNIVKLACKQSPGVASLNKSAVSMKKSITRKYVNGVLVEKEEGGVVIDVYIDVREDAAVPEVAYKIQHSIKSNVETATEYKVLTTNVHVTGVNFTERESTVPTYNLEQKE